MPGDASTPPPSEIKNPPLFKDIAVAEFNALRAEIASRSSAQHTLMNLNITVIGAVGAFILSYKADPLALLLLPILCPALGMLWVDHGINIANIGAYIRCELKRAFKQVLGEGNLGAMEYEEWTSRHEHRWFLRIVLFALPVVVMFGGVPAASLGLSFPLLREWWTWFLWVVGFLLTLTYLCFWIYFMLLPYALSPPEGRTVRDEASQRAGCD